MILTIKAKKYNELPNGNLQLTINCEDLHAALDDHSPNILIDYLNKRYALGISLLKKGGRP